MARNKDLNWNVADGLIGATNDDAQTSILMDIRDELKSLNKILNCPNFLEIPHILRSIKTNTKRRTSKRK